MKVKASGILLVSAVLSLAVMLLLAFLSGRAGYRNLLLITPKGIVSHGQNLDKIEELCEDEFLITYEIPQKTTVQAANSRYPATLVGTNSVYPDVMGYRLLGGGFFTKSAWDAKEKHAVLNKTAAFTIFGSGNIAGGVMQINGEPWIVAGVIEDGNVEDANIYVPSSVLGGQAQALMAMISGDVSGAYAANTLKSLGIQDTDYNFVNLSAAAAMFSGRFSVAWKTALCIVIILLAKQGLRWILKRFSAFKNELRQSYPREFIARRRTDIAKICGVTVLLLAGIAAALYSMLGILETCLAWQELSLPARYTTGAFISKLDWLYRYQAAGIGSFSLFLLIAAGILILALKSPADRES